MGFDITTEFPSNWLGASEVKGKAFIGTVRDVTRETVGAGDQAEDKLVLWFERVEKGLVLGKVLGTTIAELLGSPLTDQWLGRDLKVYWDPSVTYMGKAVGGIRVMGAEVEAAQRI